MGFNSGFKGLNLFKVGIRLGKKVTLKYEILSWMQAQRTYRLIPPLDLVLYNFVLNISFFCFKIKTVSIGKDLYS